MTGIAYDPGRRVSLVQQNRGVNNTTTTLNSQYAPSPYNIDISLLAYTKNQDEWKAGNLSTNTSKIS